MSDQKLRVHAMLAASSSGFDQIEVDAHHVRHAAIAERSGVGCDALDRPGELPHGREGHFRRTLVERRNDVLDDPVVEPGEIEGFPVAAIAALGKEAVIKGLDGAVGHLAAEVDERLAELAQGPDDRLALVGRSVIDRDQRHDANAAGLRRIGRVVGNGRELDEAAELLRRRRHEVRATAA